MEHGESGDSQIINLRVALTFFTAFPETDKTVSFIRPAL